MLNSAHDFFNSVFLLFEAQPIIWYGLFFLVGSILGSFLGVVWSRYASIYKNNVMNQGIEYLYDVKPDLFRKEKLDNLLFKNNFTLSSPGSSCEQCKNPIKFYHNIPILSYLFLNGKCSYCKSKIPPSIFLIETFFAVCLLLVAIKAGIGFNTIIWSIFWFLMAGVAIVDARTKLIPDSFMTTAFLLGIILSLFQVEMVPQTYYGILSATTVCLFLGAIAKSVSFVLKKESMGMGDFHLFALFGIWFGLNYILPIILISCLVGLVFCFYYKNKKGEESIPFGPCLILAAFISWLFELQIMII